MEALQDMQKAIELNDNRAIYRSRLLLDADLAARSASQARIYSDLGFQQLALVEGWKSVNTDPTNYSAHRFLADSYSILPRHEIARVSELLQSQLLQPLNMTPIQPRLAESNLFLISSVGPAALSFNEFHPLFNRNGINFQTTGLAGEHNTYAGEGILSGIHKKAAFSVGGFHFQTDGWRRNADQEDNIGNAFLQFEISPQLSVQTEYRFRETERGDLGLRFFPESFSPNRSNTEQRQVFRVGGRYAISPRSTVLGSYIFQLRDITDRIPRVSLVTKVRDQQFFGTEVQHLFRSNFFNITSGIGYFDVDGEFKDIFGPPTPRTSITEAITHHLNLYSYANLNLPQNVIVTLGGSYDAVTGDFLVSDQHRANPKFGVTWNPFSGTTIRAAAFRALKRTLATNQTLEPTQVAGFNQFFDDSNLARSWRYGGAIDQKFAKSVFAGLEFSKRELTVPLTPDEEVDWTEQLARTYLFWAVSPMLTLRLEYQLERFRRDNMFVSGMQKLTSHRVPLGLNLFARHGLSAFLTATYYNQRGRFLNLLTGPASGTDDFWTVDGAIRYRLPDRYGLLTIGVRNLFDEKFKYFETDINNPRIQPRRAVFAAITLALP